MSKSYKAVGSVGAIALVLSGAAMAVITDAEMDQWSVTNGTISAECPATFTTCDPVNALKDKGFFQRMVTKMDAGEEVTFFQTIITEDNADAGKESLDTLVFSDESFVRTGNVGGIKDKQRIAQTVANGTTTTAGSTLFKAKVGITTGYFGDNSEVSTGDQLMLKQTLIDDFDNFQTDFTFKQLGTASNTIGKAMRITAYVPIEQGDDQDFVLVSLQGDFTTGDYEGTGGAPGTTLGSDGDVVLTGPNNPGTMEWTADGTAGASTGVNGDSIQAIWIGQSLNTILGQRFGFASFQNKSTSTNNYISSFSLLNENPAAGGAWDTEVWGDRVTRGSIFEYAEDTSPFNYTP